MIVLKWYDIPGKCTYVLCNTVIVQLQKLKHCEVVRYMQYRLLGTMAWFWEAFSGKGSSPLYIVCIYSTIVL